MEEDTVHKRKGYRKLPSQTIKDTFDLFFSYMSSTQKMNARWWRAIGLPDGEQKRPKTNEEFFLYYDEPGTNGLIDLESDDRTAHLAFNLQDAYIVAEIKLPSREHVDNVLRKLTRAEEQLNASDPPKQTNVEKIVQEAVSISTTPIIFIGHGRDEQWRTLEGLLRRDGFQNIIYYESEYRAAQPITDVLEGMLDKTNIAVIIMTGEDKIASDSSEPTPSITHRSRENVIHEVGLFQGRYGFSRAIILLEEGCNEFSNIKGLTQIHFKKGRIGDKISEVTGAIRREFPYRQLLTQKHERSIPCNPTLDIR